MGRYRMLDSYSGRCNRADAADGNLVLFRPTYGTDLREPLHVHSVREAHHHWPAIEQCAAAPAAPGGRGWRPSAPADATARAS